MGEFFPHEHQMRFAAPILIPSTQRESRPLPNSAKRVLTYSSVSGKVGQTEQLAGLHFKPILVVDGETIWLKSPMMEIMSFMKAGTDIAGVRGSCGARASTNRHTVEYRISNHYYTSGMTSRNHWSRLPRLEVKVYKTGW